MTPLVSLPFGGAVAIGGVSAGLPQTLSYYGDRFFKGEEISDKEIIIGSALAALHGAIFAAIFYVMSNGINFKGRGGDTAKGHEDVLDDTLKNGTGTVDDGIKGGSQDRVFESKDPLVGEVATQIEQEFPGSVNGVNRIVHRPDGSILTDLDIELENIVIQVKSGGGKGLTRQLINTANYIKKIVIGYAPEIKPSVLNEAQKNGFQVFTNIEDLLEFIRKILGGL